MQAIRVNNSETPLILLQNTYDLLGRLSEKNLHSIDNGAHFLQSIDYRYNIRGWLTHINNIDYDASVFALELPSQEFPFPDGFENLNFRHIHLTLSPEDSLENEGIVEETLYLRLIDVPNDSLQSRIAAQLRVALREEMPDKKTFEAIVSYLFQAREGGGEPPLEYDNDLFCEELRYDDPYTLQHEGATPQYNGNIAAQIWQTKAQNHRVRSYQYHYDAANRLTRDMYWNYISGAWGTPARYNTPLVEYDLNGNILAMKRKGIISQNNPGIFAGFIDDLTYLYNGNRLESVEDAIAVGTGLYPTDFQNKVSLPVEYLYDLNGNIVEDKNAGFDMQYNHLNKPTQIHETGTGNVLHIIYAADGTKLRQKGIEVLDYSTGYLYENGIMLYFAHEEGRCLRTATQQTGGNHPVLEPVFRYEYNLKDHLGNVRVSFTEGANGLPVVIQEQHYEAYGLEMGGLSYTSGKNNRYKFNGIEQIPEFGLNTYQAFYRGYNATIGRWQQIDPKFSYSESPYVGFGNNPILYSDVMGDSAELIIGKPYTDKSGEEHPYGHAVLRIFNAAEGYNVVYDFGRYGKVDWNQTTGEGIMNVYKEANKYLASEMSDRSSVGYSKGTTVAQDNQVMSYFTELTDAGVVYNGGYVPNGGGTAYKLDSKYNIMDNNCLTKCTDGLSKIGLNWLDSENDPRNALKMMESSYQAQNLSRTEYNQGGEIKRTFTEQKLSSFKLKVPSYEAYPDKTSISKSPIILKQ